MAQVTAQLVKELRERTGVGMAKCKEALDAANGDIDLAIENLRKAGMASAVKKEGRETKEGVIKIAENNERIALVEVNAETDFVAKNENFQKFAQNLAEEVCRSMPANASDFSSQKYSQDPRLTIDEYRATIIQSLGENIQIKRLEIFPKKANASLEVYSHGGGKLVTLVEIEGSAEEAELAKDIAMHVAAESPEYLSHEEIPQRVIDHEKEIARAQIQGKPENIVEKILEGKLRAYYDQVCLINQRFIKDTEITISELVAKKGKETGKNLKVSYFLRWRVGE
jgi:elongation factor Ts